MFFATSKLVWFLLAPSNLLLCLVALTQVAALSRRSRATTILAACALFLALVCGIGPVGNLLILPLEERFPTLREPTAPDGIIVLGGAVDERLSNETGQLQLNEAAERITAMIELARRFPQARLVFSGGSGALLPRDGETEADAVSRYAEALGLPPGRLTVESRSVNTRENAVETARLVQPRPGERWLLVTSAFHMPRSVGCFRKAGFDVLAYPVDLRAGPGHGLTLFFTMADGLRRTDVAVREWIGLIAYRLAGYTDAFFPSP